MNACCRPILGSSSEQEATKVDPPSTKGLESRPAHQPSLVLNICLTLLMGPRFEPSTAKCSVLALVHCSKPHPHCSFSTCPLLALNYATVLPSERAVCLAGASVQHCYWLKPTGWCLVVAVSLSLHG